MSVSASDDRPARRGDEARLPDAPSMGPQEEFFREIFAHAAVGLAMTDLSGHFLQVNPAYCAITGYAERELLATDFYAITHPEDRAGNRDLVRRVLAGELGHVDVEKRYLKKNGTVVWTLNSVSLRRDGQGRPIHLIALCQDISERKRAEEARDRSLAAERQARAEADAAVRVLEQARESLRASEPPYRAMADLLPGVAWTARADGWVDYANRFWSIYTGMTLEQTQGSGWASAVHPDDIERVMQVWTQALQAGEQVEVEYRLKRAADGAFCWFLARGKPLRDRSGRVMKWFGLLTDIEDQKRLEQERACLLAREQETRATVEAALRAQDEGARALERQHALVRLLHKVTVAAYEAASVEQALQLGLDQVCAYTGWPVGHVYTLADDGSQELIPSSIWHLDNSERFEPFTRVTGATRLPAGIGLPGRVLSRKEPVWIMDVTRDENFPRANDAGDLGVHGAFGFPVLTGAGVVAVLEFFTHQPMEPDPLLLSAMLQIGIQLGQVFERKRADAELRKAKQAAEKANQAKSEFLSRMSHELRTPLNAILGFAQLIDMGTPTPRQRQQVEQILKGGRLLLSMINEVLDLARIEAGQVPLSLAPIRIRQLVAEVVDLLRPLAERRGIRLNAADEDLPDLHVWADEQRLKQVLLNLVSNAVKYNREAGSVALSAEATAQGRVRVRVQDTGPGLAPEQLQRLFNPFDRLGAELTEVEGSGLGLVVSKRLTEAMGGLLEVSSTPGQGASFGVNLAGASVARTRPALERDATKLGGDKAGTERWTLLYIEDHLQNFSLVEGILAHRPHVHLLRAMKGEHGLELARVERPELILLDVHLPDMKGDEVLRRLRADSQLCHIPVIVLSADATPHQIERLRAAGAQDYLTKPIDVQRFLALVDRFQQAILPSAAGQKV
jgi:PAS domain S-box-containing protein